ncbi:flagellin [Myxococcota bacterium]|nr:flagellin [Myxococcota bacterium]MBU1430407.1 flagellin [Myxococcota bacterium]MBU1898739.1 flagellin [Myxococcota bacterium]
MGLFINTNVASLNAQRRLMNSNANMSKSFERLSSGLRINSAKDDAAGLAISNRMTAQIRGLNQAVRNTNDGISLAQTAEGALDETTNILQRMRELAVQSANDTNTASDRESLQAEVDHLVAEVDRIAETTSFNNLKILDGTFTGSRFHVGAKSRETIDLRITDARSHVLGRQARYDGNAVTSAGFAANDVVINSVSIRATQAVDDTVSTTLASASAIAKAAAINDSTAFTGVRALANATEVTGGAITAATMDSTNNVVINGEVITGFVMTGDDADDQLVTQINAVADETGVIASLDANNQLVLTAQDGRNIEVEVNGNGANTGLTTGVSHGSLTLQSDAQYTLTLAAGAELALGHGLAGGGTSIEGVNSNFAVSAIASGGAADITTREGSNVAMDILDVALEHVSSIRADLGAIQNRLESTINNLSTTSENVSASRSRIMDADFAQETAGLSRNQILQQAGTSILAQANQQGQTALSLLG